MVRRFFVARIIPAFCIFGDDFETLFLCVKRDFRVVFSGVFCVGSVGNFRR